MQTGWGRDYIQGRVVKVPDGAPAHIEPNMPIRARRIGPFGTINPDALVKYPGQSKEVRMSHGEFVAHFQIA